LQKTCTPPAEVQKELLEQISFSLIKNNFAKIKKGTQLRTFLIY